MTPLLAVASDQLSAVVGVVFLAIVALSVVALVLATVTAARTAGRTERVVADLAERVAALEEQVAAEAPGPSAPGPTEFSDERSDTRVNVASRWWARRSPRTGSRVRNP